MALQLVKACCSSPKWNSVKILFSNQVMVCNRNSSLLAKLFEDPLSWLLQRPGMFQTPCWPDHPDFRLDPTSGSFLPLLLLMCCYFCSMVFLITVIFVTWRQTIRGLFINLCYTANRASNWPALMWSRLHSKPYTMPFCNQQLLPSVLLFRSHLNAEMLVLR